MSQDEHERKQFARYLKRNGLPAPKNTTITTADVHAWLDRQAAESKSPLVKKAENFGDATAYKLGVAEEVIRVLLTDRNRFWHGEYRKQILGTKT